MFKKIAEWLTGRKRSDDKHPLDYIDRKAEELHAPYKVEPVVVPVKEEVKAVEPVVEVKAVEPVVEAAPVKKPRKPSAKKSTGSKAVVRTGKPKAAKAKK